MELFDMNFSRGFSRPVFRVDLVPTYVSALRAMGLPDWVVVREKLYTQSADQVIDLLVAYKNAFVARELAEKIWYSTTKTYPLTPAVERVLQTVEESKRDERNAYRALCEILTQSSNFMEFQEHAEDWEKVKIDWRSKP
jgi:hypothetical protein